MAADEHLTCLARATEEGPPVPAHLMLGIDPRHLTLTGYDWLIEFGLCFLGGTGPHCFPVSGHCFLTGEVVVAIRRD